jgi:hypothetical protein
MAPKITMRTVAAMHGNTKAIADLRCLHVAELEYRRVAEPGRDQQRD